MKSPGAIAFSILGIDVKYYGILIAIGMATCIIISLRRTTHTAIAKDKLLDGSIIAIIAGIIGARLYYVVFSFEVYKDNIGEIFHIRNGKLLYRIMQFQFFHKIGKKYLQIISIGYLCARRGNLVNSAKKSITESRKILL